MFQRHDFFPHSRPAPAWCSKILRHYGQNRFGENLFRIVMLSSRCYIAGGYWAQEGVFGYRRVPKYARSENKWALEIWKASGVYGSPQLWDVQTVSPEGYYQVGPYPAHGEFECCAVFSTGKGPQGYVPLEPGTVDLQARIVWMGRTSTLWDIRQSLNMQEEEKERRSGVSFDELWESLHHTRRGLTVGRLGRYNPDEERDRMKQRFLDNQDLWQNKSDFSTGFEQLEA